MTIPSKTRAGVLLLLLASMPGLTGCQTFNALAGMNSPTVPPPATGSYTIPGVNGSTQPYYTPAGASGSSTPSGQWLPIQSRATTNTDSTQWASSRSNSVRTVGYDSASGNGSQFASGAEAEQNIQSRLAAEQADSPSATTRVPGQLTPSDEAQPLNPNPSASPMLSPGGPATEPLATPSFELPSQQSQPIGSGISNPSPANPASSTLMSSGPTSTGTSPLGNPGPTVAQNPVNTPPSSAPPSNWTSQSSPSTAQPPSLPTVSGSTSFRPRVKSQ